jgi:hypothetical protein
VSATLAEAVEEIRRTHLPIQHEVVAESYWHGYIIIDVPSRGFHIYKDRPQEPGGILPPGELPQGEIVARIDKDGKRT